MSQENLETKFAEIHQKSNLFERERFLIEESKKQTLYEPEEYRRLFDAYCQQKLLQRSLKAVSLLAAFFSSLTIFIGVWTFIADTFQKEQQLRASAWQVIRENQNQEAHGGRKRALEYLNTPTLSWESISCLHFFCSKNSKDSDNREILSGINLKGAHLSYVKLSKAKLQGAIFQKATLYSANFSGANLSYSNFSEADLHSADFSKANLFKANLSNADLNNVNLEGACLLRANLRGSHFKPSQDKEKSLKKTNLGGAIYDLGTSFHKGQVNPSKTGMMLIDAKLDHAKKDLRQADLSNADLSETILKGADLEGANLSNTILKNTDLENANFRKVLGLELKTLIEAKNWEKAFYGEELRNNLVNEFNTKLEEGLKSKIEEKLKSKLGKGFKDIPTLLSELKDSKGFPGEVMKWEDWPLNRDSCQPQM